MDTTKVFIAKKVDSQQIAEDLMQEVFVRVHQRLNTLDEIGKIRSWVYVIARNIVTDYYRTKKISVAFPDEEISAEPQGEKEKTVRDCLLPLIRKLPEKYGSAVWLSEIEGTKHAEVARILKISLSGAKSRIQRGRKLLQYGYMDCCNFRLSPGRYLVGEHRDDCKVCNPKKPPVGT